MCSIYCISSPLNISPCIQLVMLRRSINTAINRLSAITSFKRDSWVSTPSTFEVTLALQGNCVHVCVHVLVYMCLCTCACVHVLVCMCAHVLVCMCVHMCLCTCACVHVCVHVLVYMWVCSKGGGGRLWLLCLVGQCNKSLIFN